MSSRATAGCRVRSRKRCGRNALARIAEGRPLVEGVIGYEDTVLPAARERAARRPRRDLPGRARPGEDPHDPLAHRAARRVDADRRRAARSTTTRTTRSRTTPACSSPSAATTPRSSGCTATGASARSWPRPTRRSPTSSARSTRSRSPRAATSPTSSPSTTASCRAPTAASSRSTSSPTSPSASRWVCSTCSRSATSRSAATRSACRSTSCSLASANPEDYTNRGRIITPLKDRFGAQIRTHYPLDVETRDRRRRPGGAPAHRRRPQRAGAGFMTEIVAEMSQQARRSPHINQRSGVSVRLSIANYETLVANATRRALRHGETEVVPRVSDLDALVASHRGQDRDRDRRRRSRGAGARPHREDVDPRDVPGAHPAREAQPTSSPRSKAVWSCTPAKTSRRRSTPSCSPTFRRCEPRSPISRWGRRPPGVASATEFVLEGLHLSKRLNKDAVGGRAAYRGRG